MAAWLTWFTLLLQTGSLPASPGVKPILENERVRVWDLVWTRTAGSPLHRHDSDSVGIYLTSAMVRTTLPNGASAAGEVKAGEVVYWRKGIEHREEAVASPAHVIVIDLKDARVALPPNTSGYPGAFPRAGSVKALDNERVVVWDYTWTPGQATPMHFHDKDAVVVHLKNGSLSATTRDGQSVVNPVSLGLTRFNPRNLVHSELLLKGEARAIITELK